LRERQRPIVGNLCADSSIAVGNRRPRIDPAIEAGLILRATFYLIIAAERDLMIDIRKIRELKSSNSIF
jgi:hypothetical protein